MPAIVSATIQARGGLPPRRGGVPPVPGIPRARRSDDGAASGSPRAVPAIPAALRAVPADARAPPRDTRAAPARFGMRPARPRRVTPGPRPHGSACDRRGRRPPPPLRSCRASLCSAGRPRARRPPARSRCGCACRPRTAWRLSGEGAAHRRRRSSGVSRPRPTGARSLQPGAPPLRRARTSRPGQPRTPTRSHRMPQSPNAALYASREKKSTKRSTGSTPDAAPCARESAQVPDRTPAARRVLPAAEGARRGGAPGTRRNFASPPPPRRRVLRTRDPVRCSIRIELSCPMVGVRAPARVGHDNPVLKHRVHDVCPVRLEV